VLTAVNVESNVLCKVTHCTMATSYNVSKTPTASIFRAEECNLKMTAVCFPETLVTISIHGVTCQETVTFSSHSPFRKSLLTKNEQNRNWFILKWYFSRFLSPTWNKALMRVHDLQIQCSFLDFVHRLIFNEKRLFGSTLYFSLHATKSITSWIL
jgi:hypothetical protein